MKTLILPAEVIAISLGTTHTLRQEEIALHTIHAAQRRHLRPILGTTLYEALLAEGATEADENLNLLVEEHLKRPLALYTLAMALPALAAKVGSAGVVRLMGENFEAVDGYSLKSLRRRLLCDANQLMDSVVDFLEANPELYPQFDPEANVRQRVSLAGGVILPRLPKAKIKKSNSN